MKTETRGHINVYLHVGEHTYQQKRWFHDLDDARIYAMARFGKYFIEWLDDKDSSGGREIITSEWVIDGNLA